MGKATKQKYSQSNSLKLKIEWIVLVILILIIPIAVWSNIFTYTYFFFKCEDRPVEVYGDYYRIPVDEGYGIHPGSDYSNCSWSAPPGKLRDPRVTARLARLENSKKPLIDYDLYVPAGYNISDIPNPRASSIGTTFTATTSSGTVFRISEMNKNSDFSYNSLCSKPADGSWSGTTIGKDNYGRSICRTNLNKYIKDYIVGIDIGRTSIMLQTSIGPEETLNTEATAIFNSLKPYQN